MPSFSFTIAMILVCWSLGVIDATDLHAQTRTNPTRDPGLLVSGNYTISQTWSQESNYARPYLVHVPRVMSKRRLPVLIFLHGNGGNAKSALGGFLNRHRAIASWCIVVAPEGYQRSWNVVSERSKANDRGFIESIVRRLSVHSNVDARDVTLMGSSNGAALVNQIAIETRLPHFRNYICLVSPLNREQHDGQNFRAKGSDNRYAEVFMPRTGKRLLSISGTEDRLIPYRGGLSAGIPGRNGKLGFVGAEESIYLWAKQMGFAGDKLSVPSRIEGKLEFFEYLDGNLMHIKVRGEGHGAGRLVDETVLTKFLRG